MMFTLAEYVERYVTPAMLALAGLPDTEVGRKALDTIVEALNDD